MSDAPKVDADRLRRAVHLDVEADGPDGWTVRGGTGVHRVTREDRRLECDCADRSIRRTRCKHILAVALSIGHPNAIRALRDIVKEHA